MDKYIHTCIYIHISCPHTYTHTHIYTHAYKKYIWTHAKHVWNDGAAATAREAQLDAKKLYPSPCPHHDSTLSRPHPLICTSAEPIHPVHCSRQLPAWPWPPETRWFSCHFGGGFYMCAMTIHVCAMSDSYVRYDSFLYVPWLIHMCVMTHLYVCYVFDEYDIKKSTGRRGRECMWVYVWVYAHTHTHCTHGVLGCEHRRRDETPGGPEESRCTESRHIYIRICVQYTHVYVYATRRDEILD